MKQKPIIAITVGDYNGIGPEIVLKSILNREVRRCCSPILVGPMSVFEYYAKRNRIGVQLNRWDSRKKTGFPIVEPRLLKDPVIRPGKISAHAGRVSAQSVAMAVELVRSGNAEAVITAPVSKKAVHLSGLRFPGQTEMLQHLTNSRSVAMMLVSNTMRVGLVTIHTPLKNVVAELTSELLRKRIRLIYNALVQDWHIPNPRLAILALNPHAGEGGSIGHEERTVIEPVIRQLCSQGMRLSGPHPADAFFARYRTESTDAIVAMYHDQGLIPLKMSSIGKAVNVSVGLPIVRTSPDHGTAFDIAGKGIADPASMIQSIILAVQLASNRRSDRRRHG